MLSQYPQDTTEGCQQLLAHKVNPEIKEISMLSLKMGRLGFEVGRNFFCLFASISSWYSC